MKEKKYNKMQDFHKKITDLKLPPQNIEAEMSLLGALLLDQDAIIKISDVVRGDDFYKRIHAVIFDKI